LFDAGAWGGGIPRRCLREDSKCIEAIHATQKFSAGEVSCQSGEKILRKIVVYVIFRGSPIAATAQFRAGKNIIVKVLTR
jgi:hypothetical protein